MLFLPQQLKVKCVLDSSANDCLGRCERATGMVREIWAQDLITLVDQEVPILGELLLQKAIEFEAHVLSPRFAELAETMNCLRDIPIRPRDVFLSAPLIHAANERFAMATSLSDLCEVALQRSGEDQLDRFEFIPKVGRQALVHCSPLLLPPHDQVPRLDA